MSRVTIFLTMCLISTSSLYATTYNSAWNNTNGGYWDDNNNWLPQIVPDNDDPDIFIVTINNSGNPEIKITMEESRTISQLQCWGNVFLWSDLFNYPRLEIVGGLQNYGGLDIEQLEVAAGGISNSAVLYIEAVRLYGYISNSSAATLDIEDSDIEGDIINYGIIESFDTELEGEITNNAGARISVRDKFIVETNDSGLGGNINNQGILMALPSSHFWAEDTFANSGFIKLWGGLRGENEFINSTGGTINGYGGIAGGTLTNAGTIIANGGGLELFATASAVVNDGTIICKPGAMIYLTALGTPGDPQNNGYLEINAQATLTADMSLHNNTGAEIYLAGGTLAAPTIHQANGALLTGQGNITGNIIIADNGSIEFTGPSNVFGDVEIGTDATLEVHDGTTIVTGDIVNNGTIHMIGGRLICQGTLTNNGTITWETGPNSNPVDMNLDGQVDLTDLAGFADNWLWQAAWRN